MLFRLFHLFVAKFSNYSFLFTKFEDAGTTTHHNMRIYADDDDLDQCLYYLQTLSNVLRWSSDSTWAALAHNSISTDRSHRSLFQISKFVLSCTGSVLTILQLAETMKLHSWSSFCMCAYKQFRGHMNQKTQNESHISISSIVLL